MFRLTSLLQLTSLLRHMLSDATMPGNKVVCYIFPFLWHLRLHKLRVIRSQVMQWVNKVLVAISVLHATYLLTELWVYVSGRGHRAKNSRPRHVGVSFTWITLAPGQDVPRNPWPKDVEWTTTRAVGAWTLITPSIITMAPISQHHCTTVTTVVTLERMLWVMILTWGQGLPMWRRIPRTATTMNFTMNLLIQVWHSDSIVGRLTLRSHSSAVMYCDRCSTS